MRRPLLIALAAVATLTVSARAQAADPPEFQSPSGNVQCALQGSRVRCDMRRVGNPLPPRPSSCIGDWGHSFVVTRTGSRGRRICVTDAVGGPNLPTIAYGRTWRRGGLRCSVRRTGVRCANGRGHGFLLRIGLQRLF